MPTPLPTITPFPTQDPEFNACDVSVDISCSVTSLEGVACDQIRAPNGDFCALGAELLIAYLKYDGSLGDTIFLEVVCDRSTTYVERPIQAGETFQFRTRSNACAEVNFIAYTSDPIVDGSFLQQVTVSTLCPGPWTLGGKIAGAFSIDAFIDTGDNGVTFELHIDEVEVQLDYTVANTGQFALTALTGEVSTLTISSGAVVGGSTSADGLPVALRPRTQTVIQSSTEIIELTGRSGDIISHNFNVVAQTGNQFALPCVDETSLIFDL